MLNGRSPSSFYDEMIRTNPNFRSFIEANKGKTPEQIAYEHGIDLESFKRFF